MRLKGAEPIRDDQAPNGTENIGPDLAIQSLSSEDAILIRGGIGLLLTVAGGIAGAVATVIEEFKSGEVEQGYKKLQKQLEKHAGK